MEQKPTSNLMRILNRMLGYKIRYDVKGSAPKELSEVVQNLMKFPDSPRFREGAINLARKFATPGPFGKAAEVTFSEGDLEGFYFHPNRESLPFSVLVDSQLYTPRFGKSFEEEYGFFNRIGSPSYMNNGNEVVVWREKYWYLHPELFIEKVGWKPTEVEIVYADGESKIYSKSFNSRFDF